MRWADAGILTACFAFAWIVGFLSFLTPGGLGIREGLLGLLLSNYMIPSQATNVALLCRLWMLSAEILSAGIVRLGNTLDKATTVTDIQPKQVTLKTNGKHRTLRLNTSPILK